MIAVTGWYWIDPNLGVMNDAIQVWCNLTAGGHTCVYPDYRSRMVTISGVVYGIVYAMSQNLQVTYTLFLQVIPQFWPKDGNSIWFSEFRGGFKVFVLLNFI